MIVIDRNLFYMEGYSHVQKGTVGYVTLNRRIWGTLVAIAIHFRKNRVDPSWSLGGLASSGVGPAIGGSVDGRKLRLRGTPAYLT